MKNVRIYKDDIRTHILRSLFFTDTALIIIGCTLISIVTYLVFIYALKIFNWNYYLSAIFVLTISFIAFITQKIDNQPIYKIATRAIDLKRRKKELRYKDLDGYFTDFYIQDGYIIRNKNIIKICEIEPFDIALLNDQDRERFFVKLKQAIHSFPSEIQIIVTKRKARSADYSSHIFSLYKNSHTEKEMVIKQYAEELSEMVELNSFTITKHYAVLSVSCNTTNSFSKVEGLKKLEDISNRFISNLYMCGISTCSLEKNNLITFFKEQLR